MAVFAPWIKGRCEVTGPYREKTTAIHIPINANTGLHQVHYTWAGAAVLEALCLVFPTVNFALTDSDCVPTSLFEVAELVNLMTDKASRAEAMQHYTMASSSQCPPAVLLTTEAKAELDAGLIIVTGHAPTYAADVDMDLETQMLACHQVMPPAPMRVMRVPLKQDVYSPSSQQQIGGRMGHRTLQQSSQFPGHHSCARRSCGSDKRRTSSYPLTWM